jgi:hypothetical protein
MADALAEANRMRDGSFGWFGYGGSVLGYDSELNIGFAYTPTDLIFLEMGNLRGAHLQECVAEIVRKR